MIDLATLIGSGAPFAILHRPRSNGRHTVEVLTGDVASFTSLDQLPATGAGRPAVLALVPYRQVAERGFAAVDDGVPLVALTVRERWTLSVPEVLEALPAHVAVLHDGGFDLDDDDYAGLVRRVVGEEIGRGEGANFVLRRSYSATLDRCGAQAGAGLFRHLLQEETGAYWTFLMHTGEVTMVGATPERHVTLDDGVAAMTPISGTFRYPASGSRRAGLLRFLADRKESEELLMVLDEELKTMAAVCDGRCRADGPYLREMAELAHTEYLIEGPTQLDVREVLRRTVPAPAVSGSPVESACRMIARYEPAGRGYYSGVVALLDADPAGRPRLDSAILIRTAEIDPAGTLRLGVGATIVRHSDPVREAAETRAKATAMLRALDAEPRRAVQGPPAGFRDDPAVRAALSARNAGLNPFWLVGHAEFTPSLPPGTRVLIVDAEDSFTAMLAHQVRSLGAHVDVCRYDAVVEPQGYHLVVMGPGPGDPRRSEDPKMAALRDRLRQLLADEVPLLAVCLSHQVLCGLLGLPVRPREQPHQGVRRAVVMSGRSVRVGFYNTFAAYSPADEVAGPGPDQRIEVSRDADGEVYALRGHRLRSMQFHPESVLSADGRAILTESLVALLPATVRG